ncbi:MAG: formylmethanofuran--tetrahydromethanopterin N-formyltransferase [Candidatus Bathyarchaeota archaeon]|nr:formylmethanofuran--tetrahydromethanopterin N-formyltransferase [Candidatus Bathyarchaeota archaeon]
MGKPAVVEDTFAEAFEGIFCRVIITADDQETVVAAAQDATATPSVVIGRVEGGVERYLTAKGTPDNRVGAVVQFWAEINPNKPFADGLAKFEKELSYRIRQDILVKPFTAVYDFLPQAEGKLDMMDRVGHCGDGYEWTEKRGGREVIVVPLMVPDFVIERYIGYAQGVTGGNFWILCQTKTAVKEASAKALEAINQVEGVITPFDVCSAGSKPQTHYPQIGPTTNHPYCPTLKPKLGAESKVPQGVNYIPEIVVNGVSMRAVQTAMKKGIQAAAEVEGVVGISAGNYEGKLGKYKINLCDLFA